MARSRFVGQSPAGLLVSGRYYRVPNCSLTTSATNGVGFLRLLPKFVPNTITVAKIGAEVTVVGDAGSKVRLGIYADDGNFHPGELVLDAGTIAGDSATVQEITDGATVLHGGRWYWFGGVVQVVTTTQPELRVNSVLVEPGPVDYGTSAPGAGGVQFGSYATGVTGALPSTFTYAATTRAPSVFIKAA